MPAVSLSSTDAARRPGGAPIGAGEPPGGRRLGQRIVLGESDLVVDGGEVEDGGYQPGTFVEYPYLIVGGTYARLALSRGQGSPPVQLVVGSCDECPEQAAEKLP